MQKQVIIDCFPENAFNYRDGYVVVVVDVIRATTSAITIAAAGGRCFPAPSLNVAIELKKRLRHPLLAGEIAGEIAPGFELNNSPADLAARDLAGRPVVLLSSSGTRLIHEAKECLAIHLACFRNYGSVARNLAGVSPRVAVIGAGSRGEFREEDQMCCAWIARDLAEMGHAPADKATFDFIKRWATEPPEAALASKSAAYLRKSRQTKDLNFILGHINDLRDCYQMQNGAVVALPGYESEFQAVPNVAIDAAKEPNLVC